MDKLRRRRSSTRWENEKPPACYHYTNDVGVAGIIESGQLRFSHRTILPNCGMGNIAIDILKLRATAARLEAATFASMAAGHFFICCFSNDGDDLA
jgi:hypothetical protein